MRLLGCLLALSIMACQHVDTAEHSAEVTAHVQPKAPSPAPAQAPAPAPAPTAAPAPGVAPIAAAEPEAHCGCGMTMSTCNGQCGNECGGEAPHLVAPANATWTTLHVTGMHCGGCARRIERALASVHGVLGVQADFATAQVRVATTGGVDVRHLVQPTIDGLGYHVE